MKLTTELENLKGVFARVMSSKRFSFVLVESKKIIRWLYSGGKKFLLQVGRWLATTGVFLPTRGRWERVWETKFRASLMYDVQWRCDTISSTEAALLLVSTKNHDLWPGRFLTIDCKADTTWKTFRDTNMTRTDKAGSQQWTAVALLLELVSTV